MKSTYKHFSQKDCADLLQLNKALRKLQLKYHPDMHPDDGNSEYFEKISSEINVEYEIHKKNIETRTVFTDPDVISKIFDEFGKVYPQFEEQIHEKLENLAEKMIENLKFIPPKYKNAVKTYVKKQISDTDIKKNLTKLLLNIDKIRK